MTWKFVHGERSGTLQSVTDTVFWNYRDGSRAVEIDETLIVLLW